MTHRINLLEHLPEAYLTMREREKHIIDSGLNPTIYELIRVRASQINGCAHCINMHTRDAIRQGETTQRLFLLDAWRETDLFTEKERAVLALTESITLVSETQIPDEVYETAAQLMEPKELAAVILAIIAINGWNRVSLATRLPLD